MNRFWSIWPIRLVVFFLVTMLAYGLCGSARFILKDHGYDFPRDPMALATAAAAIFFTLSSYWLLVRLTERRKATELEGMLPYFIKGALVGLALFAAVYGALFALHVATFKGFGSTADLAPALALSVMSGICEEIIFRGALFRIVEDAAGSLVALIVSGAVFGLLHAGNPGATVVSTVAIMLEAGILLAAAYMLTRSLWFPIGLHFAWNFSEGGIFGAQVSGNPMKGLLDTPISGPPLLSGGGFGPEASVVAVGVCVTLALAMLILAIRRGQWKPMHFSWRA
ncbi:MAG TPA: CPBP family intramembrane glutamic endopeptidase [Rhizomicrobium sp.]